MRGRVVISAIAFGLAARPYDLSAMRTGKPGDYSVRVVEPDGEITLIEVKFHDDGSRWRTNVSTSESDQAELERLVQSLLDQDESKARSTRPKQSDYPGPAR
jgi:hypothetical protein